MVKKAPTVKRPCEWLAQSFVPSVKQSRSLAPIKNYYLILYNAFSCLGWAYLLVMTYLHLTNLPLPEIFSSTSEGASAFSFHAPVEYIRALVKGLVSGTKGLLIPPNPLLITVKALLKLLSVYNRMITTYDVVGGAVAVVQTAAALEIAHSISGLVKSPIPTAVMQVYSRLFLVWGITQMYGQVCWHYLVPITRFTCSAPSRVTTRFTRP